jgi:transposase
MSATQGDGVMLSTYQTPIWLYSKPVDFRKQIDGLVILIADQLSLNPTSGQLFLFRNRSSNKIKLLWWDRNGFWLCYKRLEEGRLMFPPIFEQAIELTRDQLSWLLSGLDYLEQRLLPEVKASNFF